MWNVQAGPGVSEDAGLAPVPRAIDRGAAYKRIATEEAWNIPEVLEAQVRLLASPNAPDDSSLRMAGMFSKLPALQERLMNIGEQRIARMDELGIDKQLLLLTSPGVQVLEPDEGTALARLARLARLANERLAAACRRYPDRFAGLTVFAPQNVKGAVAEIERGMTELGLNGAVINSHFRGHYLDELPYWPILEALEAHDAAPYIHPAIPPTSWSQPDEFRGFGGAPAVKLRHKISYYFKHNIWITTSGQEWEPSIRYCIDVLGPGRVLYAMDYPYQQSADEVAAYDGFDLPAEHKKMLMQTNAERVFRLTP
jgi:predicted TIM-barrel fold metal-dependent hydrolase